MSKGPNMGITILALIAVVALIATVIVVNENASAEKESVLSRISSLEGDLGRMEKIKISQAEFAEMADDLLSLQAEVARLRETLQKQQADPLKPQSVELQQKKPFYVQLVPQNLAPVKKKAVKK